MTIKLLGALCVILGCGSFGFMIAGNAHKEVLTLRQLVTALDFMESELNYRMTPLPQLCRRTAEITRGCIKKVFTILAEELELQITPGVNQCVSMAVSKCSDIPSITSRQILELGRLLGMFDLSGQIKHIKALNAENMRLLEQLSTDHTNRLRSYKTLALCAGAALVILFI